VDEPRLASVQQIGGCTFRRTVDGGGCTLGAVLDCALPGTGERLTGTFRVTGAARAGDADASAEGAPHVWTPLTGPAMGDVSLDVGGRPLVRLAGRGYHDRNHGSVPLHALGIGRWMWGRVPLAGRELVYYLLWPSGPGAPIFLGVELDEAGRTSVFDLEVEMGPERRELGGVARPERLALRRGGRLWLDVAHRATVDAGPFYLRLLTDARSITGEAAAGWSEVCVPGRVDLAAHRPFVRMRVHHAAGPNSPWLPLFTGPRQGRARRLLRHLFSRNGLG
jgi:carotenoid 1,2-hydratase